jgi:phosphonoacetate hydrolase
MLQNVLGKRFQRSSILRFSSTVSSVSSQNPSSIFALVIDGYDPAYTFGEQGKKLAPTLSTLSSQYLAKAQMPTFTNVNNVSILTGTTPKTHGIAGNFLYDEIQRIEIPMIQSEHIRSDSLLAKAYNIGYDIVIVTAKEKLVKLLSHQLPKNVLSAADNLGDIASDNQPSVTCISLESASIINEESSSRIVNLARSLLFQTRSTLPTIYDPEISIAVIELGNALVQHIQSMRQTPRPIIAFLSTTDYVQHKHSPFSKEANHFYTLLDKAISDLLKTHTNSIFGLTADHGMTCKYDEKSGKLNIIYVEQLLNSFNIPNRTILPITDAHIVHHASLGGYATIHIGKCHSVKNTINNSKTLYFEADEDWKTVQQGQILPPGLEIKMNMNKNSGGQDNVIARKALSTIERIEYETTKEEMITRALVLLQSQVGIQRVFRKKEAAEVYSLPIDRIGDLVVVSNENFVIGKTPTQHDLEKVDKLRSHGGESEITVPLKFNKSLNGILDDSTMSLIATGNASSNVLLPLLFKLKAQSDIS